MSGFVKEEKDSGKNTGFFLYSVEKDIYCVAILYCGGGFYWNLAGELLMYFPCIINYQILYLH